LLRRRTTRGRRPFTKEDKPARREGQNAAWTVLRAVRANHSARGCRAAIVEPFRAIGEEKAVPFIAHSGMVVSNLERSVRFYCDLLGFRHDRNLAMGRDEVSDFLMIAPPGADLKAVYLYMGDFQLELMSFDPPPQNRVRTRGMHEVGLTHLSVAVDSIPAVTAKLAEYGGELMTTIGDLAAIIRDPDGQLIELLEAAYAGPERRKGAYGASLATDR
jgi:catechol 2,3-dioxygenase-like lactoylglutathione lyase family enzyme